MEGRKNDQGKLPLELLPLDALEAEAAVLQFGATKYAPRNWEKGMKWGRLYGATLRHLFAWWKGEAKDPETGLSHLAHASCCIHFLLAYELRRLGEDDRPGAQIVSASSCAHAWRFSDVTLSDVCVHCGVERKR